MFDTAGAYTFAVTISDGIHSTTSSVNVIVTPILTSVDISPALTSTLDQFGNSLGSQPNVIWSSVGVGSVDSTGLYVSAQAGNASVVALAGALNASSLVTVTNSNALVVTTPAYTDSPVAHTITADVHVAAIKGLDDSGLTYHWDATTVPANATATFADNDTRSAKDTTATVDQAGTYVFTVTATDGNGNTVSSSAQVVAVATLSSLQVTPDETSIYRDSTVQFAATGLDQFGNPFPDNNPISFAVDNASIGMIGQTSGVFTAAHVLGNVRTLASDGVVTGSSLVHVVDQPPVITVQPTDESINKSNSTVVLTVHSADPDDSASALTYTWALVSARSPNGGLQAGRPNVAFSENGTSESWQTVASFRTAGTYTFSVTISDGEKSTVGLITVKTTTVIDTTEDRYVADIDPIVANGQVTGFTVFYNGALDAANAANPLSYRVGTESRSHHHRSLWQRLTGSGAKPITKFNQADVASATYDTINNTVTLMLDQPMAANGRQIRVDVLGNGKNAITWNNGDGIDGNDDAIHGDDGTFRLALPNTNLPAAIPAARNVALLPVSAESTRLTPPAASPSIDDSSVAPTVAAITPPATTASSIPAEATGMPTDAAMSTAAPALITDARESSIETSALTSVLD